MGIIGVVAALTLPNLNSSTGDKEKVAKLQKIYSNLEDAFGRATAVYGPIENWCTSSDITVCTSRFKDRLSDFLKVSKDCNGIGSCFFSDENYPPYYAIILADGSSLNFSVERNESNYASASVTNDVPEKHLYGYIFVDIDGAKKGKNDMGYDIFQFLVTSQGIIPSGSENYIDQFNPNGGADYLATDWIIRTGNMDYLKIKNGKCPDGKTVLNLTTNITCK